MLRPVQVLKLPLPPSPPRTVTVVRSMKGRRNCTGVEPSYDEQAEVVAEALRCVQRRHAPFGEEGEHLRERPPVPPRHTHTTYSAK